MAKSKSFFGLRRGSTKAFTFQVLNGGQITKDRVVDVKNPRTRTQMAQRMIMATAGSAYKHMREIVDHSFEGVSYGQRSYSAFMRLNVHDMVEDVRGDLGQFSYNPYGDTNLYASPFIIARGSLNNPNKIVNFANDEEVWEAKIIKQTVDTTVMTVDEMLKEFDLQIGDLLTICGIVKFQNEDGWQFWWARFKVRAGGTTIASDTDFNAIFEAQASEEVADYRINENGFEVDFDWSNVEDDQIFGTTILSRKSNNKWLRSNAQIIFPGSPINSPTAEEALATYPVGTNYILNGANINGGGIAPDNSLRLIERLGGESRVNVEEVGDVLIATFNRPISYEDLAGKISMVFWDSNQSKPYLLTVYGHEEGQDYFELADEGTETILNCYISGNSIYANGENSIGTVFDVDFDQQHRRRLAKTTGSWQISMPGFADDSDSFIIGELDDSDYIVEVYLASTEVGGDYVPYVGYDGIDNILAGSWFNGGIGFDNFLKIKLLMEYVLNMEYETNQYGFEVASVGSKPLYTNNKWNILEE